MPGESDSEDDFIPKPKGTVRLTLRAHLPPSDKHPVQASPSRTDNVFSAFKCKRGAAANGVEPAEADQDVEAGDSPSEVLHHQLIQQQQQHEADVTAASSDVNVTIAASPAKETPGALLEDASPSPVVQKRRMALPSQDSGRHQANKRRIVIDDSDDEDAPARPQKQLSLVPETPNITPATVDLTSERPSPVPIEFSDDDEEDGSQPQGVLEQCEGIAQRIRAALGDQLMSAGSQTEAQGALAVVDAELLTAACGGVSSTLKPYQLVGVNWMLLLARLGVGGCILADEMGLGKTAQACCYLGVLAGVEQDPGPHMVVAPASLLENWRRELQHWCPGLQVASYHGAGRMDVREDWSTWHRAQIKPGPGDPLPDLPFDVLLTTYTPFERNSIDHRDDRKFFSRVAASSRPWSHMVLDEAHAVKSRGASRTVRLRALAAKCKRRIFLTGTPLQNDLTELKTLLSLLEPKVFGDSGEQLHALEEDMPEEQLAAQMRSLLDVFLLRRLKEQVASQLVAKQQLERQVTMPPAQADLYAAAVQQLRSAARGGAGTAPPPLAAKKLTNMFVHLRKIAQHPLLVRSVYTDAAVQKIAGIAHKRGDFGGAATLAQVQQELAGYSDHDLHRFCASSPNQQLQQLALPTDRMRDSAKFKLLAELLPSLWKQGHRVLIFSQWTSILDLAEWLMQDLGLTYVRLDGSTAVADRLPIVDSYNQDTSIFAFLLSTRAGGQGLNLVGADQVILHDVDFNPQIDRQAEDRSHRLGQERPVTVYRLVTTGTVDADILRIAQRKLRLDAAVLAAPDSGVTGASDDKALEKDHMSAIIAKILSGDA